MSPAPDRGQTRRTVRQGDLRERTLGVGDPRGPNAAAGVEKARYAKIDLTGGGGAPGTVKEYDVIHDLGKVPTLCELARVENAIVPGTFIIAKAVREDTWSHTHCTVSLLLQAGSFDGCMAHFKVSGA